MKSKYNIGTFVEFNYEELNIEQNEISDSVRHGTIKAIIRREKGFSYFVLCRDAKFESEVPESRIKNAFRPVASKARRRKIAASQFGRPEALPVSSEGSPNG